MTCNFSPLLIDNSFLYVINNEIFKIILNYLNYSNLYYAHHTPLELFQKKNNIINYVMLLAKISLPSYSWYKIH